jgi:hypothetical protein
MNTDEGAKSGSGHVDDSELGRHAFTDFIMKLTSRLPLLAGVGATLFSVLLIMWCLAALLMSTNAHWPIPFLIPFLTSVVFGFLFPVHNVARKSWLRAVGNAVGLILAIPTGLYGLMFVALIIEGISAV